MPDKMVRRKTRTISIGNVKIGGTAPVSVQSMTNTDTRDVEATVRQIKQLERAGCEIIRIGIPDMEAAGRAGEIKEKISIPLIADIHFDCRLALKAIEQGVHALRINPGNIGKKDKVKAVVEAARGKGIPIRIGVNSGSLEKDLKKRYNSSIPEAMVESAMRHINILEDMDFHDIKISLKGSNVMETVEAYKIIADKVDYPLHIGITEAGTLFSGTIKSSLGLGILLYEGIGDTLRVSLSSDPVDEVRVGFEILKGLNLRQRGVNIISCPTCSRQEIDVIHLAGDIEKRLLHITNPLSIAVMGCVVNGPGEAKNADIGITGGKGIATLYKRGRMIKKIKEDKVLEVLVDEVESMI